MNETNRPLLVVYAAAALAVALIGARYLRSVSAESPVGGGQSYAATASSSGGTSGAVDSSGSQSGGQFDSTGAADKFRVLVVHVAGAVRHPGLVRLRDGDRVGDAIKAAGGRAHGADLNAINLAMRLADGQQVIVPARVKLASGAAGGGGGGGGGPGASAPTGPISLGSATAEQLDQLDGIGPGLAAKIIAYRTEHGGFRSIDELGEVPGIGDKRIESLRAQLQP